MKRIYVRPKTEVEIVCITTKLFNASTDIEIKDDKDASTDENDDGYNNLIRHRSGYTRSNSSSSGKGWGSLW